MADPGRDRLGFPAAELRERTTRGALVNGAFVGGAELLLVVQGLVVTAILGPELIGLYGAVSATAVTITGLKRVGIDEEFVRQSEPEQEAEFQRAFTLDLSLSLVLALVIAAAAPFVALAYGDDRLLALTLAVSYLPVAFSLQAPTWIFFRRMDFLRQRLLQAIVPLVTVAVTIPLAVAGVGVWSLVIGPFVANATAAIAAIAVSPYPLRIRRDRSAWSRYLRFSWPIFVSVLALLVVLQGQVLAFDLAEGLAAAGFITLAATLTRYADRVDRILASTIYPAICAVQDRPATLTELFAKSNRLGLAWVTPFCAGLVLFAPDLVEFVLGDDWEPAVGLLQGLAVAAGLQQLGYNWFSFYRAANNPRPQAVESAVMVGSFLLLAVPALFAWGFDGFVAGRIAGALLTLAVRRHYVARLLPGVSLLRLAVRGLIPALGAAAGVMALRLLFWGAREPLQAGAEVALFMIGTAALTWVFERGLLGEAGAYLRRAPASAPAPTA
jgi:O-antigen/teichoic acid export membrane protein